MGRSKLALQLLLLATVAAAAPDHGPKIAASKGDAGTHPSIAPEVKTLVDRMQAFYEKTNDFIASFRQEYTYKTFNRTQTSNGKVTFLKPAMMRWDYEKPTAKTFVLSGDKVYAYDPEAMTMTISAIKTNELSASVTFLWGVGRLEKEFSIAREPCASCKGVLLELTPLRQDPRFQKVQLEVDPKTAQVLKTVVVDPDGSENGITFSDLKTGQGVAKDRFKIDPPPDTQVIDLTKAQK
jgi:outer membrane lipoprotein carrier protein